MAGKNSSDYRILKVIAHKLYEGRAAVLVGAGFSRNADKSDPTAPDFPIWRDLSNAFYKVLYGKNIGEDQKFDEDKSINPMELAEQVEATLGRTKLDELLKTIIPNTQYIPSELYRKFLRLPWTDVFTTNYDTLLERTSKEIFERNYECILTCEDLVGSANNPRIIKLHGSFPSQRPFITTLEDYREYPKNFAPFVNTVQQSLLENTFCLLGFSGSDPNFLKWIGWIRDTLGNNAPKMYLLTHSVGTDAEIKVLENKSVYTININCVLDDKTVPTRKKYDELFDFFTTEIMNNDNRLIRWPNEELLKSLPRGSEVDSYNLLDINKVLQKMHTSYPDWIIMPNSIRNDLNKHLDGLISILQQEDFTRADENSLTFLYEYDWLRENSLMPLLNDTGLPIYERSLPFIEKIINTDEDKKEYISILLSLMHTYRENGREKNWKKLFNLLQRDDLRNILSLGTEYYHRFHYECCLKSLYFLRFDELIHELDNWKVKAEDLEWSLRKAGLLAENNQDKAANTLLQSTLNYIRVGLRSNNDNCKLLSMESAAMEMMAYLNLLYDGNDKNDLTTKKERDSIHRQHKCSIPEEKQIFESLLSLAPQNYNPEKRTHNFDFGHYSITYKMGDDELTLNAYSFLRFSELVAIPFRLQHVIYSSDTAKNASLQVAPFSSFLAVTTLIRADSPESAESLWIRPELNFMTQEEADEIGKAYLKFMNNIMKHYRSTIDPFCIQSILNSKELRAIKVLSIILSHFCCKCSLDIRDEILDLVLQYYEYMTNCHLNEMNKLTERLISSYSYQEIIKRIDTFNRFPLDAEIDPFSYIMKEGSDYAPTKDKIIDLSILLKQCEKVPKGILRLVCIYQCGLLTEAQNNDLEIWAVANNQIVKEQGLLPYFIGMNNSDLNHLIETQITADLKSVIQTKMLKSNAYYWEDLCLAAKSNIFQQSDLTNLFLLIKQEIAIILPHLNDRHVFIFVRTNQFAKGQLESLQETVCWLILNAQDQNSGEQKDAIQSILMLLQQNNAPCMSIDVIIKIKYDKENEDTIVNLLSQAVLAGGDKREDAFDAIYLLLDATYHNKKIVSPNAMLKLLEITSEQIKWRQNDDLSHAISIVMNGFISERIPWDSTVIKNVLTGLQILKDSTRINHEDNLEQADNKGALRKAAARLAAEMIHRFPENNEKMPRTLLDWKKIIEDSNEFVEIRKNKSIYT